MADEESVAKNRGRRTKKEKKRDDDEPMRPVDSTQSHMPAVKLKQKHVYDSLEHCRATRSRSNSKATNNTATANAATGAAANATTSQSTLEEKGSDDDTLDFIESLRSKSVSRSGRFHDTSVDGKPFNLKISTWNINGLKSWLETKCSNNKLPAEIKNIQGYNCYWNGSEDGQSGVVCFSKKKPLNVSMGLGIEVYDKEARVITLEFEAFYLVNVYVPNSGRGLVRMEFRMKWDVDFLNYLKGLDSKKPLIVCGDLNVSHQDMDIANPKTNLRTAGFTVGERCNFTKLLNEVNLIDVFRFLNPDKTECFTYWTYTRNAREKNIGWRLDYFLISKRLFKKICDCIIRNDVYGSDHCPVSLYVAI